MVLSLDRPERPAAPEPRRQTPSADRRTPGRIACLLGGMACLLGFHRMEYAGIQMGRRLERCRRCGGYRVV